MLDHNDFVVSALLEESLITDAALAEASLKAAESHVGVLQELINNGKVSARQVAMVRAGIAECPYVDLAQFDIDISNASRLPRSLADRLTAFPLFVLGKVVTVGMADPLDLKAVDQLRTALRAEVEPVLCEPEALRQLISRSYSLHADGDRGPAAEYRSAELTTGQEPIVAAVNHMLAQAIESRASDIHIGPDERELILRYRVDGTLQRKQGPPLSAHAGIVQRIKVMASLDLTQSRRPQDGKFRFAHQGRQVDIRVSIIPTVCGENVVMRILAGSANIKGFAELGFAPEQTDAFQNAVAHPHGMVLVTGPTGSGKTTTLYTALNRLNTPDRNIMTIEDPVEIRLPMVRQVQVNPEIGMTFAGALRSILRQDPNVVLVGEIRDQETAKIAIQAAMTGHLVLSTLHTNDAPGAVARLVDFGCPPFAINTSLLLVLAQRLVKRNCPDCQEAYSPAGPIAARFSVSASDRWVHGAGCTKCSGQGARGRIGIFEVLRMTAEVQRVVGAGGSTNAIREAARRSGMRPMWQDGVDKARLGWTTLEEVARVAAVEEDDAPDTHPAAALSDNPNALGRAT
ncbi:MAG: type II/IV secretion system protein [Phycisphaerales bacterium]|nr:type II/IV secretion system protein [Phycisphaerales bacterium]